MAEVHYVSARLYEALELKNPRERAAKLVKWLRGLPAVGVSNSSADLAAGAGKAKLNFGLAPTDCYVLAASRICGCKALFRKREKEMRKNADALEREYQIIFLKDYK